MVTDSATPKSHLPETVSKASNQRAILELDALRQQIDDADWREETTLSKLLLNVNKIL